MPARAPRSTRPLLGSVALCLLALALVLPSAHAVQVVPSSDTLPHPLFGYGIAKVEDRAYLVGGATEDRSYTDEIRVLQPDGSSSVVANLPERLNEPAVASVGSRVYIFGGATQPTENQLPTTSSTIYRFDTDTGELDRLIGTTLPDAVSSASAVRLGSYIYVMGGLTIASSADGPIVDWQDTIVRFDTRSEALETLDATLPTGRGQMAAVGLDSSILLFGGFAERGDAHPCEGTANTCMSDQILRVRPQGDDAGVGRIGNLPEPVRWAGAAVEGETAYVLGGCQNNCGGHFGQDRIVAVDTGDGEASVLSITMPLKGGRHRAVVLDGLATLPGGVRATASGSQAHERIHRLELGATPPWAPVNLTANPAPDGGVRLDWQAPGYDGGSPITSYEVQRSDGGREAEAISEIASTSFTDTSTVLGTTYTYQVRAINQEGAGPLSNEIHITPTATPAAPEVSASGGDEKVLVQWSMPEDAGGSEIDGFRLYAYPGSTDPALGDCQASEACWGELSGSATFATVRAIGSEPLENGQTYAFRVQARNTNGWGVLSEPVEATPKRVPDPPEGLSATPKSADGTNTVELAWNAANSPDVASYAVYRGQRVGQLAELARTSELAFADQTGLADGATYHYAVAAIGGDGEGPLSQIASVTFAVAPSEPSNLSGSWTGAHVEIWWDPPSSTGGAPLDGYEVARTRGAREPSASNATIHPIEDAPYTDADAPKGQPVVYHVRAVGPGGQSPWALVQVRVPLTEDSIPPKAVVSVQPSKASVGEEVVFDASGSTDDTRVVAYSFAFGDGRSTGWTSTPRVSHVYKAEGVYEATIKVRDTHGLESARPATPIIAIGPAQDGSTEDGFDPNTPSGPSSNGTPVGLFVTIFALGVGALGRRART